VDEPTDFSSYIFEGFLENTMLTLALTLYVRPSNRVFIVSETFELSGFNIFTRGTAKEFLRFFSRESLSRLPPGAIQSITERSYQFHCVVTEDLSAVLVTDTEYPVRTAHILIRDALDSFRLNYIDQLSNITHDVDLEFPYLTDLLRKQPTAIDKILGVQQDIDVTKIILVDSMEKLLQRGEKLDHLVNQSNDLSETSKRFLKQAKKTNSCCSLL